LALESRILDTGQRRHEFGLMAEPLRRGCGVSGAPREKFAVAFALLAEAGSFPLAHNPYASGHLGPAEQATHTRLRHF
jgi:hypothetical protein